MRIPSLKLFKGRFPRKPRRQTLLTAFTATLRRTVRSAAADALALVPSAPPLLAPALPLPPPAPSRVPGFTEETFTSAAGTRRYKLFIPAVATSSGAMPLVVMLHGCGQDPDDFAAGTGMNKLANENGFAVLYPAQCSSANPARCWNWYMAANQTRGLGEAALIADMTRAIVTTHALDGRRVFAAGLSAGGAMAAILAAEYPDLYAAVGVHSGLRPGAAKDVFSAMAAMRSGQAQGSLRAGAAVAPVDRAASSVASAGAGALRAEPRVPTWPFNSMAYSKKRPAVVAGPPLTAAPLIAFHGDADATVHPLNAVGVIEAVLGGVDRSVVTTRVDAHRSHRAYTHSVYRQGDDRSGPRPTRAESWIVHGGQHAWSGGDSSGSHVDAAGPDASREMLRFFLEHPLAP